MSGVEIEFSVNGGGSAAQEEDDGGTETETGESPEADTERPARIQGLCHLI